MKKMTVILLTFLTAVSAPAGLAMAATDSMPAQGMTGAMQQEQVFGSQLMTQEERSEYHAQMRAAKTEEEREIIRQKHHESMQERAKAQGVTLPDEPPVRGGGMGMGPGGGGMMHGGGGNR